MDHTKNDIFEAMGVKEEDVLIFQNAINNTEKTLQGVADTLTKLQIQNKQVLFSYYFSSIADTGTADVMQKMLDDNSIAQGTDSMQQCLMRVVNLFTLAALNNDRIAIAMVLAMNAILLLSVGPSIPRSYIIESVYNGMITNKLSYYEMLKGIMTVLTLLDPIDTEDRILQ